MGNEPWCIFIHRLLSYSINKHQTGCWNLCTNDVLRRVICNCVHLIYQQELYHTAKTVQRKFGKSKTVWMGCMKKACWISFPKHVPVAFYHDIMQFFKLLFLLPGIQNIFNPINYHSSQWRCFTAFEEVCYIFVVRCILLLPWMPFNIRNCLFPIENSYVSKPGSMLHKRLSRVYWCRR